MPTRAAVVLVARAGTGSIGGMVMPLRSTAETEPSARSGDLARALARRCEPLIDVFVQRMVAQWAVQLPEHPTLRGKQVADTARLAVMNFLRRAQGAPAAGRDARVLFRRRAAHRAQEGMPLPILLRSYTIAARVLFEEFCRAARPEEAAALPQLARLLLLSQDEAIEEVARAYQEELALLGSARRDRRRELVRDLVAGVAPEDPAALEAFGLADGATVLALRLGSGPPEPGKASSMQAHDARPEPDAVPEVDAVSDLDGVSGLDAAPGSHTPVTATLWGTQNIDVTEAAVHRRLHRLYEAIDEYFGGSVPALLEATGGHALVPSALLRASGGRQSAPAPSLSDQFVHRLMQVWGGEVHVAAAVADGPERIGPAARMSGEILRLVGALDRAPGVYALDDVLLEYHLTRNDESAKQLGALLDPLADRPDLLRTVRVFLEEEYDRRSTARRLGLHPNTVDNRLARVTELTGLNPATPRGVAQLITALALRDLR